MRQGRVKAEGETAVYHCVTRVVAGEMLLDADCKEVLRKMLWQVAGFCGVEILAYCLMTNHFHVLVRVPEATGIPRDELLRRYRILYGEARAPHQPDPDVLATILEQGTAEEVARWESRLLRRMNDVSEFMKTLKQRFSVWYNKTHGRYGTLWAERFKSVLVEDDPMSLQTVAAYIDLNPVRAGLAEDPANYRWSSYGEAMGGRRRAQAGLASVVGMRRSPQAAEAYRMVLFGKGGTGRVDQELIPREKVVEVLSSGGKVPRAALLRCRVRYFSDGVVLGSKAFVEAVGRQIRAGPEARERKSPALPITGDAEMMTYRCLRKNPVA